MFSVFHTFKTLGIISILILNQLIPQKISSLKLIKNFCLSSLNKEIKKANIPVKASSAEKICECFLDQLKKGDSIRKAKEYCKSKYIKSKI